MKQFFSRAGVIITVAVVFVLVITSCSSEFSTIAVTGTWQLDGSYESGGTQYTFIEQWTITPITITYSQDRGSGFTTAFAADIVALSNEGLNGGDTYLTGSATTPAVNPGFAVIRYTQVDGASTGEVGKYNVFRWAENAADTSSRDFSQGYLNVGGDFPDNVNGVFDSVSTAINGATNGAGYFTYASGGAALQQ